MGRLRRILSTLALVGVAAAVSLACSPIRVLDAVSTGGSAYRVSPNLAYGENARQRLDLYTPAAAAPPAGWPVVVFFHGGSWSSGDRSDYAFVGAALARRGVLVAVADYRLYPEVRYPDFLRDSARALAWGLEHARRIGGDPARVFVMGHSAGGYNAAMLALDARWLAELGHSPHELAGWIGLPGPYDFFPSDDPQVQVIFHAPDYPPGGEPIDHIDAGAPPTFLGAPPGDRVVSFTRSTQALGARLQAAGTRVSVKRYPRATHATVLGALAWPLRWAGPVSDDVVAFIDSTRSAP